MAPRRSFTIRPRRLPVDSSLSVLSGHRSAGRDRYGRGTRAHEEHPPALRHVADRRTTRRFAPGLERLADRIRPELVLISAGFDAHAEDPVGDLGLEVEDFEILTRETRRGRGDPRPGPDRQRARRGLQRADPGRLASPLISTPGRRTGTGSSARTSPTDHASGYWRSARIE